MFCSECGARVPNGANFCPKCGIKVGNEETTGLNEGSALQSSVKMQAASASEQEYYVKPEWKELHEEDQERLAAAGTSKAEPETVADPVDAGSENASGSSKAASSKAASLKEKALTAKANAAKALNQSSEKKVPDSISEEVTGIKSIYIFDFMSKLVLKENRALCAYLVINVFLIGFFCTLFFSLPIGWGLLCGLILYTGSVALALSPIGEWMLRNQTNCHKITDKAVIDRLQPVFEEVYTKAREVNPSISQDVRLFMNEEKCPNAFATGRKTVCVTRGLLDYTDDEIKGVLAHEFGHLSHKDTDRLLVIQVGNTVISAVCFVLQVSAIIAEGLGTIAAAVMGDDGWIISFFATLSRVITLYLVQGFLSLWSKLGIILCMKSSRDNEYLADAFAGKLGYSEELQAVLATFNSEKPVGLFAELAASHPNDDDRIAHLKQQQLELQTAQ